MFPWQGLVPQLGNRGQRGGGWAQGDTGSQCQAQGLVLRMAGVGVQNKLPQDVALWCAGYCELKATLARGSRETSARPLTTWKNDQR